MAKLLGCGHYYAGYVDKDDSLQHWLDNGGCIVSSTALGTGVNYDNVVWVVHMGIPYGLIDFAQESGRGGRQGEVVNSIILLEEHWEEREKNFRARRRALATRDELAMLDFVRTGSCRRHVLSDYFDGLQLASDDPDDTYSFDERQDCISSEMEPCDRCEARAVSPYDPDKLFTHSDAGIRQYSQSQVTQATNKEIVTDALDEIASGCTVCWIKCAVGDPQSAGSDEYLHSSSVEGCNKRTMIQMTHNADTGTDAERLDISEERCNELRKKLLAPDNVRTCWKCGIYQRFCNRKERSEANCQWPNIAVPVLLAVIASPIGRNIVYRAGYEGDLDDPDLDLDAYALWLVQASRKRLWGELVSNSMVVIAEFLIFYT
jgi:superfamily II DNA helicase RecQ